MHYKNCFARSKSVFAAFFAISLTALAGCQGADENGIILGSDDVTDPPAAVPSGIPAPNTPNGDPTAQIGPSCHTSDTSKYCLSLKYVAYANSAGRPTASEADAISNVAKINTIWAQCGIAFEIGEYTTPNPSDYGLNYNTSTMNELTSIRRAFYNDKTLLVVTTGDWSGSLGSGSANAWTTMPGGSPHGAVLEANSATYAPIIAHELGHYLNLDHVSDQSDVMNPTIYTTSTKLTSAQCSAARSAVSYFWTRMLR